jgi:hypothetical protein
MMQQPAIPVIESGCQSPNMGGLRPAEKLHSGAVRTEVLKGVGMTLGQR